MPAETLQLIFRLSIGRARRATKGATPESSPLPRALAQDLSDPTLNRPGQLTHEANRTRIARLALIWPCATQELPCPDCV